MPLTPELPDGWHYVHLDATTSTMNDLRQPALMARPEPFVLLSADFQTAGRGQRGTHWEADAGTNLLFGILCRPTFLRADRQFFLSEVQALAVAEAVDEVTGVAVCVKWPNDIYVADRKLCGMLLEHDLSGTQIATTITGVGLNVNQPLFRSDAPNPVSLRQILGRDTDRPLLLSRIAHRFHALYAALRSGRDADIHAAYLARLYRREGLHRYADASGEFSARFVNVSPSGLLLLRDDNGGEREYAFKEVRFVL